jgi:hypothetical protein
MAPPFIRLFSGHASLPFGAIGYSGGQTADSTWYDLLKTWAIIVHTPPNVHVFSPGKRLALFIFLSFSEHPSLVLDIFITLLTDSFSLAHRPLPCLYVGLWSACTSRTPRAL